MVPDTEQQCRHDILTDAIWSNIITIAIHITHVLAISFCIRYHMWHISRPCLVPKIHLAFLNGLVYQDMSAHTWAWVQTWSWCYLMTRIVVNRHLGLSWDCLKTWSILFCMRFNQLRFVAQCPDTWAQVHLAQIPDSDIFAEWELLHSVQTHGAKSVQFKYLIPTFLLH